MFRFLMAVTMTALVSACTTVNPYTGEQRISRTAVSGTGGAAAGAALGAVVGALAGDAKKGALIGAATGAVTGAGIGAYQDRQQAALRERLAETGISVTREGDIIHLNMPADITFELNRADISPGFYRTLNDVALVLRKFDRTQVGIFGHADSTGPEDYNMDLSLRRARSVASYLAGQGIAPARLHAAGFGETRPVAPDDTPAGRRLNRRVEIVIRPAEDLF